MKQIFTLVLLCFSPLWLLAQQTCQTATVITAGTYSVAFDNGSQAPAPSCNAGFDNNPNKGAWFSYTPTAQYTTTISTHVAGFPDRDTRVHIYSGPCNALVCVGGDDDSGGGNTSLASFTANAGTTYYIAFDNNWNGEDFHFNLTEGVYVPQMFSTQFVDITNGYSICITDMNGDYLDDMVVPMSGSVKILYQNAATPGFTSATLTAPTTMYMPDWSMAAGDYDNNGYNDLLYGNGGGATIMLANDNGTAFDTKLESPEFIFSQRTNFVDINADGNLDAFVCHDIEPNVYFLNDGSSGFDYEQGGLGDHPEGGNYGSIWIDYNNDGNIDLFIAKCRGGGDDAAVDELYRNNGDGTFSNVAASAGFADLHQSWSAAWADFDNDGDMDVMIGNSAGAFGGADPNNPLNAHKVMRNNGDGTFTNVTVGSGYDVFTTPNLEHVAHDFNNDGFVDVLGGGNTIMMGNGDLTFTPQNFNGVNGAIGDLNDDGFLDIQNGNVVYMSNPNDNNWLKLHLQGVESNRNGIGARVEIHGDWGVQIRDVRSGDGFKYMSSLNTHFGLGEADQIDQVVVKWPSGTIDIIDNPDINQALMVVEGSTLGMANNQSSMFILYPNPAKDILKISGDIKADITTAHIYDMSGKLVKTTAVTDAAVPVQSLAKGTYIIILQDIHGKQHSTKFIKG